jgi:hypothetical protein
MPNITITNVDLGSVILELWGKRAGTLENVEVTEQTYAEGTLLSRNAAGNLVPFVPAAVPDGTVDVTVDYDSVPTLEAIDMAVLVPGALVGDIVTITPLGTWPVGITLPQGRVLVAGTVQVRVANVTAGAVNPGSQVLRFDLEHNLAPALFVLTYEVVLAASSSTPVEVMSAGKVDQNRLVIHNATVITAAMLDDLTARGIIPVDVKQLAKIDNPQ